jgi:hypothetical protein
MGVPGQRSQAARKVASATCDVLDDTLAVWRPRIDAEGEVSSRLHRHRPLAPILFGFSPHRRRIRIFHLEPIARAAGTIA